MRALDHFADENKTRVGHECDCDWMRSIHFEWSGSEKRRGARPFTVNTAMPRLQTPNGVFTLLSAAKRTMLHYFRWITGIQHRRFFPSCACSQKMKRSFATSWLSRKRWTAFVKKLVTDLSTAMLQKSVRSNRYHIRSLEQHPDPKCAYCDDCAIVNVKQIPRRIKWSNIPIQRIRASCKSLYQPLKVAMEKELQFVRYTLPPTTNSSKGFHPSAFFVAGSISQTDFGLTIDSEEE